MGLNNSRNLRASLNASSEECRKALAEYYELARLPELSEKQFMRMQFILREAESHNMMSLLINEIDEITFQELGFYNENQRSHFDDEVAKVQEFVLEETERKVLTPSSIHRQSGGVGDAITSYYHPRVEMVFDASHTARTQLEKRYLFDDLSVCHSSQHSGFPCNCAEQCRRLSCRVKKVAYKVFIEESVSLFTVAGFLCLFLFLLV